MGKKGRDSKFGSNGWVFDKLFTKLGEFDTAKHKKGSPQILRDDDPDYKQVTRESIDFMKKIGKGIPGGASSDHSALVDKIREIVKNINKELSGHVSSEGIESYDLQNIFKQMFELYDLTDFGKYTITENSVVSTSQILNFINYIMKGDKVYDKKKYF